MVRGIRSIKFFEICPISHLLGRMDVDSIHVVKRIVSLLVSSFQPSNAPISEQVGREGGRGRERVCLLQVARCLTLIEMNTAAARTFYQLVVTHLPPSHVVRFMLALYTTVKHAVEVGEGGGEGEGETKKKKQDGEKTRGRKREGKRVPGDELKNHSSESESVTLPVFF